MAAHQAREHQLGVGSRLDEAPSAALLTWFGNELRYAATLYEGLSYADLAHTVMLIESGIIPTAAGRALLGALVALHDGGLEALPLEAKWGDLYNNRDAELERRLGTTAAGWLHAGRARREALTLGWLIQLRAAGRDLVRDTAGLIHALANLAVQHLRTLMPDFTYLQHAQPTTLAHYLLGFAYPVLRDAHRLARELRSINSCPAGSGSTNGSRLPLDRERLRELLGFERLVVHNRDAMWQSDVPINLMAVLVSLATTADRLAEDLQIWATDEFGFIELADQHCRASVIMPNKKNPYAVAAVRGKARELGGQLMSVIATNQTPSGQLDNRNTAYELLPNAITTVRNLLVLLAEVVTAARFNVERLRQQADTGFTYGTELADLLMQREGVDARSAHEIVGAVVAEQAARPTDLAACIATRFTALTGRVMQTDPVMLVPGLTAEHIVGGRRGIGSCGPHSVELMVAELRSETDALAAEVARVTATTQFPAKLRRRVAEHLGREW
jgi:argininosuccinate lyase